MPIFKPKQGPIFTWSRALHLMETSTATLTAGLLFGWEISMAVGLMGISLGFWWETMNHWWPPGPHMFGDWVDFAAFVAGAAVGFVLVLLAL